jgi:hypothetical protein
VEGRDFHQFTRISIVLETNAAVTMNMKLEGGASTEAVTINASAAQVKATTATVSQVADSACMVSFPPEQ